MADPITRIWMVARVAEPDEGGVQTYVREVARAYAEQGRQVTLFVKSSAGPRRISGGRVQMIDVGPGSMLRVYALLFLAMCRAWREGDRPQAIHACTWRAALPALLFRRPLTVTVHGREVGRPRGMAMLLLRMVMRRAARIVAVSDATRTLLLSRLPHLADRSIIAWNGVVMPMEAAPTPFQRGEGGAMLLSLCRLVPRKNIVNAVRALALKPETLWRDWRYIIAGRGPDAGPIGDAVHHAGLEQRITLAGYVPIEEVAALQARADIFLHPQIALEDGAEMEGFGLSIADAMAQGLACIVGRDGGPAELVQDGVTGFIVDGRSVEDIHAAVALLASDPALCRRLGQRARSFAAAHFSWDRHCRLAMGEGGPAREGAMLARAA